MTQRRKTSSHAFDAGNQAQGRARVSGAHSADFRSREPQAYQSQPTNRSAQRDAIPSRRASRAQDKDSYSSKHARRAPRKQPPVSDDSVAQYSRNANQDYAASRGKKRKRGHLVRNILIIVALLLVVGGGVAWAYVNMLNSNLNAGIDSNVRKALVAQDNLSDPFYMLLMGVDKNEDRENTNVYDGLYRTDSIILARVDPKNKTATMISIPRDTQVEIPDHGLQKINAAYTFGGPSQAISTVSQLAGVPISHFATIDMDGMSNIVEALGGVEVNVPYTIDDSYTGHLDAGLQVLDGDQALIFSRSRHAYDDVGDGDEYRAANQRVLLSAIAKKVLSADLPTIARTVTELTKYVKTDMSVQDIVSLAQSMKGMDTDKNLYSATMPNTPEYTNGVWWTKVIPDKWKTMMQRVDQGLPPTESTVVDKTTGIVMSNAGDGGSASSSSSSSASSTNTSAAKAAGNLIVRNGTNRAGLAAEVSSTLTSAGYTVADSGNADADNYKETMVIYDGASRASQAAAIASTIGHNAKAVANDGSYAYSGDFLIVIGANY